jgi:IstB-like ATP binding protein
MAKAFEEQFTQPAVQALSFEERFGLLVDREHAWRDSKRMERLLKNAKLKVPGACIEDIDYRASRALDKRLIATLGSCDWLRQAQHLILCGAGWAKPGWLAPLAISPAGTAFPLSIRAFRDSSSSCVSPTPMAASPVNSHNWPSSIC